MNNFKFKILNFKLSKSSGFTLIEVIVTMMVFSVMAILISAIFARAVELERRTVWAQRVQENATFVLESMAKEIRIGNVLNQDSPSCTATTLVLNHPTACDGDPCNVTYSLSGSSVLRQAVFSGFINSSDVQFTRLRFCITGTGTNDNEPPKVTILMSLRSAKGSPPLKADLETTVVSRDLITELLNP